ncbi:MAG: hypothetical protein H2060_08665 [Azoarcus sp.]|nr:hypothetical protein [Azoarcus sp.]
MNVPAPGCRHHQHRSDDGIQVVSFDHHAVAADVADRRGRGPSEWRNVHVLGSWAYSPSMPTILDIGLAPLAQWAVVPLAATLLVAKRVPVRHRITQS